MNLKQDFLRGIWEQNPTFRLVLGMCPTLAVTNMAINGVAMGLATLFVLVASALIVSLIKNFIPSRVRIPSYILVIATFVTLIDYLFAAFSPQIHKVLGIYIPLIVVNCIILGRMEVVASKSPLSNSLADALGMGLGFTLSLTTLGMIRELLGFGTIFGITFLGSWYPQMLVMKLPTGAFITLGLMFALVNKVSKKTSPSFER
ncbi:MAG: electron transport complex subunit E [candidate division WOR-3 bacterium]|nr:electron transport complex subunit E [candidate division WOR-3 bacterium]